MRVLMMPLLACVLVGCSDQRAEAGDQENVGTQQIALTETDQQTEPDNFDVFLNRVAASPVRFLENVYRRRADCAATMIVAAYISEAAQMHPETFSAAQIAFREAVEAGAEVEESDLAVRQRVNELSRQKLALFGPATSERDLDRLTTAMMDCAEDHQG